MHLTFSPVARANGIVKIEYKAGFSKHCKKFRLAIENLLRECITVGTFGFELGFEKGFGMGKTISDLEARMAVFYSGFLDSGEGVKPVPNVDQILLKDAMKKLRTIALGMTIP